METWTFVLKRDFRRSCFPTASRAGFTGTYARTCTHRMTVLWSDSRAEFTPVYNGVVRALLTPDDYNQQPFRETTPPGRVYSLFYFPFERCEPPRDRNHGAVCGYLRNCLTNTRGRARPRYFCIFCFRRIAWISSRTRYVASTGIDDGKRFRRCSAY